MTLIETQCLAVFRIVIHYLTGPKVTRWEYVDLLGKVRDIIYRLEAMAGGCATGKHFGTCTCRQGVTGVSDRSKYRRT